MPVARSRRPVPRGTSEARLTRLGRQLLIELGENPDEPRIADTPRRWARWWLEFTRNGAADAKLTTFDHIVADQLVVISGMRLWSLCEHHLLPFYCDVSIGYIPTTRVLGLSKFARIAQRVASRLQIQERLVEDIAAEIEAATASPDVAVIASGEHLCLTMRGAKQRALMTSSAVHGRFREPVVRAEFLSLALRTTTNFATP